MAKGARWLERMRQAAARRAIIVSLGKQGYSRTAIALNTGLTLSWVGRVLAEAGINPPLLPHWRRPPRYTKESFTQLLSQHTTMHAAQQASGFCVNSFWHWVRVWGLQKRNRTMAEKKRKTKKTRKVRVRLTVGDHIRIETTHRLVCGKCGNWTEFKSEELQPSQSLVSFSMEHAKCR